jgi:hypothetical protein
MKGKEAARSANRRHGAAMEHLRQLTEDLASYRVRARDAETEARQLRVRVEQLEHQIATDRDVVDGAVKFITEERRSQKEWSEKWYEALGDVFRLFRDAVPLDVPTDDCMELFRRRYPKLWLVTIRDGDHMGDVVTANPLWSRKGFDATALRRLGRALGRRAQLSWDDDRDMADVMADLLDMRHMGLEPSEAALLMAGTDDPVEARAMLQGKTRCRWMGGGGIRSTGGRSTCSPSWSRSAGPRSPSSPTPWAGRAVPPTPPSSTPASTCARRSG